MEDAQEPKRKSFIITAVQTFHRGKIVSKACFVFPSKKILDVVLHYNKSERICVHTNMENSLYKYNLISSLKALLHYFSLDDLPLGSLALIFHFSAYLNIKRENLMMSHQSSSCHLRALKFLFSPAFDSKVLFFP